METDFLIRYSYTNHLDTVNNPEPHVEDLFGDIFMDDPDYDTQEKIGEVELIFYNSYIADLGFSIAEAFENNDDTISMGYALLDRETDYLKGDIIDVIGKTQNQNILVIHNLILLDEYRGKGHGIQIMKGIELFFKGKCGYIALESRPIQHDNYKRFHNFSEYKFQNLDTDIEKSEFKLNAFFHNCGYIKPLWNEERQYFMKNIELEDDFQYILD